MTFRDTASPVASARALLEDAEAAEGGGSAGSAFVAQTDALLGIGWALVAIAEALQRMEPDVESMARRLP